MITTLVASTVLLMAPASDLYDAPILLDIGVPPPCTQDSDCNFNTELPVCDVETGECVECLAPEHCPDGWACSPTGSCRDACEEQADCEDVEDLCNPETGFCAQCIDATNCAPEEYCEEEGGFCRPDLCEAGQTTACSSGMIVECTADGGPGSVLDICAEGCEVVDGMAQCVMTGGTADGTADGTAGGTAGTAGDEAEGDSAGSTMGSSPGTDASGGSGGTAVDATDDDEGCACRADAPAGGAGAWSWWLVVGLGLARRRRR